MVRHVRLGERGRERITFLSTYSQRHAYSSSSRSSQKSSLERIALGSQYNFSQKLSDLRKLQPSGIHTMNLFSVTDDAIEITLIF